MGSERPNGWVVPRLQWLIHWLMQWLGSPFVSEMSLLNKWNFHRRTPPQSGPVSLVSVGSYAVSWPTRKYIVPRLFVPNARCGYFTSSGCQCWAVHHPPAARAKIPTSLYVRGGWGGGAREERTGRRRLPELSPAR